MVLFIEHQEQISDFIADINNSIFPIVIPIWQYSNKHPQQNSISFWYFRSDANEYIIGNHSDIIPVSIDFSIIKHIYTPRKKELYNFDNITDISGIELFKYNNVTDIHSYYSNWQKQYKDANIIPITKWVEMLSVYSKHLQTQLSSATDIIQDKGFQFLNNITIPILHKIEAQGLLIDTEEFEKHYYKISDNIVFTSYNPYTITGRPSNTFNRVNFAAIPKNTGARKSFIKQDKILALMDFESFHLRLIAKQIGIPLDFNISVHEQLAKQYFNTDNITKEQYAESKQKTFAALYNYYRQKNPIKFFEYIYDFIDALWTRANNIGFIETPEGRKIYLERIIDISEEKRKAKLFNYYVQSLETEESMLALERLIHKLAIIPILYTYDSFLFQISDITLLEEMQKILENNEFPVRIYTGENYHDLTIYK